MNVLTLISALSIFVCGCTSVPPPAVRDAGNNVKVEALAPLDPGMGRVVFVRPDSPCDDATYPTIVDENAHFVAQISQNSRVVIDMTAGEHTLFVWPNIDLRDARYPDFDPVGVAKLHLHSGETVYAEVFIPRGPSGRCWRGSRFEIRGVKANERELRADLAETKAITVDVAVGNAELRSDPALVAAHLEAGRRTLTRNRELRDERRRTQQQPRDDANATRDSEDTK